MPRLKAITDPAPEAGARSPVWWLRWVPAVLITILLLDLFYIAGRVAIVPVLASFALAYLISPLAEEFEARGFSRRLSALFALALVMVTIVGFLAFVLPELWEQSVESGKKISTYFTAENAQNVRAALRRLSTGVDRAFGPWLEQFIRNPAAVLSGWIGSAAGSLTGFLSTAVASLDLLLVPFFVFYILVDFARWRTLMEDTIPPRYRSTLSRLFDEVGRILEAYVRGQILVALAMAVLYAIGFAILRVPAWAGLAALSGFLNAVPYVGTLAGLVLASGFTLASGAGLYRLLGVVGVFAIVQAIEAYYLTPRILGGRLNRHPMAVFLGLLIGGKLFGILGVLLAVPTIAVSKVFLHFAWELYKGSYFYHHGEISAREAPSPVLRERLEQAAETVLTQQGEAGAGDELLAPSESDDDPAARVPGSRPAS